MTAISEMLLPILSRVCAALSKVGCRRRGAGRIDPGTSGSGINALTDLAFAAVAAVAHCVTVSVFKFSVL